MIARTASLLGAHARDYVANEVLRDGRSIHIRAIRPDDKARLLDHFRRLSPESRYFRFCGVKKELLERDLVELTEVDFVGHVCLVATLLEHGEERIIGVGRSIALGDPGARLCRAEVAFAVADEHHGRGIGTALLAHLVPLARAAGITEFEADVLGSNHRMLGVFAAMGFVVTRSLWAGMIHLTFPTEETEPSREASVARERVAAARSMRAFLNPRSVAVIGASRRPDALGTVLLRHLGASGFTGPLYPVNPHAREIGGRTAFASVSSIAAPVDLAVIAVPAAAVETVVAECAEAGVRGVLVVSAGFAERSAAGKAAETRLREAVRGSGMRLVGPNAAGVLNTSPEVRLNATFARALPPAGNIGMMSQSGALGIALLDHARRLGTGISSFASVGNKADVSGNDLLCYWADDPATDVIALYLESFGNPRRFARLAPEVARLKPIVAVKAGRSAAGARAASSHSAAAANADRAAGALFAQAGVIRTDTLEELFDVAELLSTQPVPAGSRVGVVTNAGGPGTLLADACEAGGLTLPSLSAASVEALRALLPAAASVSNPVDMLASASAADYARAIAVFGADESVDALVVIHAPFLEHGTEPVCAAIAAAADLVPSHKPVVTVRLSMAEASAALNSGLRRLPSYTFPENAARALGHAAWYGRWRRRPRGTVLDLEPFARSTVRAVVERVATLGTGSVWLEPPDVATILRAAGIECSGTCADGTSWEAALAIGIDARVAVETDPTFGPLVACRLGGPLSELAGDVSFRLPPVSDFDAEEMIRSLRLHPLLDGYGGRPGGDSEALVSVIQRVSALVDAIPEIQELELSPVKVRPPGGGAFVAQARMRVGLERVEPFVPLSESSASSTQEGKTPPLEGGGRKSS